MIRAAFGVALRFRGGLDEAARIHRASRRRRKLAGCGESAALPTKLELVISPKTARAAGRDVSPTVQMCVTMSLRHWPMRGLAVTLSTAAALSMVAKPLAAETVEQFYRGKQIRLIVSTDIGGAYDTYARLLAQVMKDHIPGNPSIIVQNMPGASGLKAANYIYNAAPRDGTVIAGTYSSVPTGPLTSPAAALYDIKKLSWIGSITSDPYIGYVWHTAPIKSLEDAKTTEVIMGGVSVGTAGVDIAILAKGMFGLKLKIVTGYKSATDVKLAMERGEVQGTFANAWSSIKTADPELLTEKKILIIVQHGFKKHPELPDVPLIFDLAKTEADRQALTFMLARQQAAKPYFGPPEIPTDHLDALRRGFDATIHDPRFIAMANRAGITLDQPMTGDELASLAIKISQTPTSVIERVNRMLTDFRQ
jgi:tripartite-type tricarboxylate transporter receptor subunit TctC